MRCSASSRRPFRRTRQGFWRPRILTESAPHRRAEALVQMARHACAHAEDCHGQGGNRATLIFGMPHQSLLDSLGTAGTPDGKRLPAAAARRMACDAGIIPAVYGADSANPRLRPARPAPPPPDYAATSSPETAAASGPAATGHRPGPRVHHREHWVKDRGETERRTASNLLCLHHHRKVPRRRLGQSPSATITDRTPWFHPPDGRPPLRGQRRPLLRPATDTRRRMQTVS